MMVALGRPALAALEHPCTSSRRIVMAQWIFGLTEENSLCNQEAIKGMCNL
jgi:hypothetical protein